MIILAQSRVITFETENGCIEICRTVLKSYRAGKHLEETNFKNNYFIQHS